LFLLRQEREQVKRKEVREIENMMRGRLVPFDARKGTSQK
jgi:hypothetical protein